MRPGIGAFSASDFELRCESCANTRCRSHLAARRKVFSAYEAAAARPVIPLNSMTDWTVTSGLHCSRVQKSKTPQDEPTLLYCTGMVAPPE